MIHALLHGRASDTPANARYVLKAERVYRARFGMQTASTAKRLLIKAYGYRPAITLGLGFNRSAATLTGFRGMNRLQSQHSRGAATLGCGAQPLRG